MLCLIPAQIARFSFAQDNIGEVIFKNGKTRPYIKAFATMAGDTVWFMDDLSETVALCSTYPDGGWLAQWSNRCAKLRFSEIARIDFLEPSKDEKKLLNKMSDEFRKGNVTLKSGKKLENVFFYSGTIEVHGPLNETYRGRDAGIVSMVAK
jgi:hypothetical protein